MAVNLANLVNFAVNTATGVIADRGTLLIETPTFDDDGNVTGASRSQTVRAVAEDKTRFRPDAGAEWTTATFILFVPSLALSFVPSVGDFVTWAGTEARINAIDLLAPAGSVVGLYLACGGG